VGGGWGRTAIATIPRNADLLSKVYLVVDLGNLAGGSGGAGASYVDDVGRAMIDSITLEAGSVQYDVLYPEYMHAWEELSIPKERQLQQLTGKCATDSEREVWARNTQRLYIPLEFYFQRDYTSSIPLIALHLTDIKVNVKLKRKEDVVTAGYNLQAEDAVIHNMFLLGEYVFLDDPERRYFSTTRHHFLINQVQRHVQTVTKGASKADINLYFNHPVKEMIVLARTRGNTDDKQWFNFAGQEEGQYQDEAFQSMSLMLNNNHRVKERDPLYYRVIQNSEYHTRIPDKHIYVYSFALSPESPAPSGSLNLSRIENTRIEMKFSKPLDEDMDIIVFVRGINVIKVFSGIASLKWAS